MRLQNYQKVIAACKDTTSASGTYQTIQLRGFELYLHSGLLLPCFYPEYGLPGSIKFPRNGADTYSGVNPCNHRKLLFFLQY